ncbi:MAG: tRNA (guanosine(37)-N1)-methyltransferase TrmD [Candidatus Zixiibacteriota bacterium]
MKFRIITLFPDYFRQSLKQSLLGKALDDGIVQLELVDLREIATDKHRTVDDTPFGGGGGMVMKIEPLDKCLSSLGFRHKNESTPDNQKRIVLTSAAGETFNQTKAIEYSLCDSVTIICGHYLGVDERLLELYNIEEVSIGDYVLTGGEPAAAVMVDAISRLIPKVLGNFESALGDSFMDQITGTPCYTRPAQYQGISVPQELLSGNHEEIKKFRRNEAIRKCMKNRPDLINKLELTADDLEQLKKVKSNR